MGKLREAPPNMLRNLCLYAASALAKASFKATPLFQIVGFFQWKAQKSSNKHPLNNVTHICNTKFN
jgi:nicotinamide riboside transporter PnuC